MRFGLCGPSYTSQSLIADAQVLRNWYLEKIESGQGKSAFALYPKHGLKRFAVLPDKPVRGGIRIKGRVFFVGGASFCEVLANGTVKIYGAVANDGLPVSMATSGDSLLGAAAQILIASDGHGYVFTLATNVFTADPANLTSPAMVACSDDFFISLQQNSAILQVSNALDALTWDPTQKTAISVFPDDVKSILVDHREVFIFGEDHGVAYYDSGDVFPFAPIPQAYAEMGIAGARLRSRFDSSVAWWGKNEHGWGIAWRIQGYQPVRISDHAVETAVQSYGDISNGVSYSFQDQGHTFFRTYFPSANNGRGATWDYDAATQTWSEADRWINGQSYAHPSQCHVFGFNKHLVGDLNSGNIYEMAIPKVLAGGWDFVTDDGNPIRRVRRTPVLATEDERLFFERLVIDLEVGLGPVPALVDESGNARAPRIMLRWSDDGGKTWSNEYQLDCGQAGEYRTRVYKNKLGSTKKGRVFEISTTDPIPWRIIDGYINEPVDRLTNKLRAQA